MGDLLPIVSVLATLIGLPMVIGIVVIGSRFMRYKNQELLLRREELEIERQRLEIERLDRENRLLDRKIEG